MIMGGLKAVGNKLAESNLRQFVTLLGRQVRCFTYFSRYWQYSVTFNQIIFRDARPWSFFCRPKRLDRSCGSHLQWSSNLLLWRPFGRRHSLPQYYCYLANNCHNNFRLKMASDNETSVFDILRPWPNNPANDTLNNYYLILP